MEGRQAERFCFLISPRFSNLFSNWSSMKSIFFENTAIIFDMRRGRPSTSPRSAFGNRLLQAREQAGLSQAQVAQKLGVLQRTVAFWERRSCTLLPEQITALSELLKVPVEQLLFDSPPKAPRGPAGRVKKVFEEVSDLPRRQQQQIADVVEALVVRHGGNGAKQHS